MASLFRQLFPIILACLISVSFGMMLGWPSLAYPELLNLKVSPIPVTLDETSLIAGFLMEGNTIGCLFTSTQFLPAKFAICICYCMQIVGWIVMYYSRDIFWFLASRSSIGFANGFAWGQIRRYITETCDPDLAIVVSRYTPVGMSVGILAMHVVGSFVDFRTMALYATILPTFGLIAFSLTPQLKKEECENRLNNVISMQAKNDLGKDFSRLGESLESWGPIQTMKDWGSLKLILIMFLLIFIQQYGGGPANIVYSTIIFISTHNPYPWFCSTIYTLGNMVNMILALRYSANFSRKVNLLTSTGACVVILTLVSLYFYLRKELLDINEQFVWAPLFLLLLYNFFHTFSYGVLPLLILSENINKKANNIGNQFWIIHFSMSAVISTKIFQVLFTIFNMAIGFFFFVCILLFGFIVLLFIEDYAPRKKIVIVTDDGRENSAYVDSETAK